MSAITTDATGDAANTIAGSMGPLALDIMAMGHERAGPRKGRVWRSPNPPRVSFVIPTLNEEKNLPHVLPLIPLWAYEVVVVDGRSKDDTVAVAKKLLPDVRVIHETRKGKGAALRAGFAAARGDIIVMLDADGSMDPREAVMMLGALLAGADLVKGSRFIQGGGTADMSLIRMAGNLGLTVAVRTLFGGSYSDLCYGYSAFWSDAIAALELDCDGFEVETQINVRALRRGLRIVEVPSFEACRIHGESNLRALPDGWRVLRTILGEWTTRRRPVVQGA